MSPTAYDVAVIGAGAAGMMCAAVAGQRGRSVVLIDHAVRPAEKIRISGGGRCNFTNTGTGPEHFISSNPDFCRLALDAYRPRDFIGLVQRHRIPFHEKHRGQLFCDDSSESIINMLRAECELGRVKWRTPAIVTEVTREGSGYQLATSSGVIEAAKVVVATGGLSIPKIGASDFGYRIARQFGLGIVEPRPALVPLTFAGSAWAPFVPLAGIALPVSISAESGAEDRCEPIRFEEDLLFTHRGLSGPAVLQISSYWEPGRALRIDLAPGSILADALLELKTQSRQDLANALGRCLPKRLAHEWLESQIPDGALLGKRKIAELPNKLIHDLANSLQKWRIIPSGTEGFRKAEVTRGGVDTTDLFPHNLEARRVAGLHFIGEVVDVTGWLGGYNFQWAWASAVLVGRVL